MTMLKTLRILPLVAVLFVSLTSTACDTSVVADIATQGSRDLSVVSPESVGMSSERLERLNAGMQKLVDDGKLAGITTMVARHGKIAHFETFGHQDIASGTAMPEDAIFRIYSMSKPITGVALMMLYEEGAFRLGDPVA